MKVIIQIEPKDLYEKFSPELKKVADELVVCLMGSGAFDTEQQTRDWATIQIWKSLKNLAKQEAAA